MGYIAKYKDFKETNESMKTWLTSFLLMSSLGLVPLSVKSSDQETKKEFVESQPQSKLDAAKFVDFINRSDPSMGLDLIWADFVDSNNVSSSYQEVSKYLHRDGKKYRFDKKWEVQDFSGVDMNKFTPKNWLTDMGSFIPDSLEPKINNWISDYEKKTSIEIGIITVKSFKDGEWGTGTI